MDLKLYALLKNKIKSAASACSVVTSDLSVAEITLTNNSELRFLNPVTSLVISGFAPGSSEHAEVWSVIFTAGDGISVSIPTNVEWSVAEPAFISGYTYYLIFIPFGSKILGVWAAKELLKEGELDWV